MWNLDLLKQKKNQENFIFFGDIENDTSVSVSNLIIDINGKYYKNATFDIKPLTFVIRNKILDDIKKNLIQQEILFNDGYEHIHFNEKVFFKYPVTTRKSCNNGRARECLGEISFKLRILSESEFYNIQNYEIMPNMVYYFDFDIFPKFNNASFMKIEHLNTKQISEIFIF